MSEPSTSFKRNRDVSDSENEEPYATDEDSSYVPSDHSLHSETSDVLSESSISEEDQSDPEIVASTNNTRKWQSVDGRNQKQFPFTGNPGIKINPTPYHLITEYFCFNQIIDEDIITSMTTETNKNAARCLASKKLTRKSRLKSWTNTDNEEMKKFLGLLIWMGLKKLPSISCYWSTKQLYRNNLAGRIMSRNRFELLLRFWHFDDDTKNDTGDRLFKIRKLVDALNSNFKKLKQPDKYIAIDETMVPFRGRLQFRQYIPGKRHKYGVKLFKICDPDAYTYEISIYQGKSDQQKAGLTKNVVLQLSKDYLNEGRFLVTDNFYTSLELADDLLQNKTHLIGTLRKSRKGLPKEIISTKLKKGEVKGQQDDSGITVMKWKDQRDVLALSTCHTLEIVNTGKKNRKKEDIYKPSLIMDYNKGKSGIDLSDQLSSYSTPVRKSLRWYHKVATEILLGTAMVNAYVIYKSVQKSKKSITEFREKVCEALLQLSDAKDSHTLNINDQNNTNHKLTQTTHVDKRNRKVRRRCIHCYEVLRRRGQNSKEAADSVKKVTTICCTCEAQPSVCISCFTTVHTKL